MMRFNFFLLSFYSKIYLAKLSYLESVFNYLDGLNLSLQGKDNDIFSAGSRITAFQRKLGIWKERVKKMDFSDFGPLQEYLKTCGWEQEDDVGDLPKKMSALIEEHIELLRKNRRSCFPEERGALLWIVNPFVEGQDEEFLVDLQCDLLQKSSFLACNNYSDYWVGLLKIPEYRSVAIKALSVLIQTPSTYLCEAGFSAMTFIKNKQRNALLDLDSCMRLGIEDEIEPQYSVIAKLIQEQKSH